MGDEQEVRPTQSISARRDIHFMQLKRTRAAAGSVCFSEHDEWSQKSQPAREKLRLLRQAVHVAEEVGALLG